MKRPWPLTGRDEELRRVAAAIRPGAAGIVVAGPAGVGKTRLAREALAVSGGRGVTVVWAHGSTAARPFPLGAFAGLLDVPVGDPAGTIGRALVELARQRPLVLAVDDAHLLDEHSAIVLHRMTVRRLAPVVVTLRAGEPAPDTVTSLWKDDHLPRLDLEPLDVAETTSLVARVLGGPVELASARWPTRTPMRSAKPPTSGPGSATSSPPATRRPSRPMSTDDRGGKVRLCPPRPSPRSWPTGPGPAPRPSRSRPGRCR